MGSVHENSGHWFETGDAKTAQIWAVLIGLHKRKEESLPEVAMGERKNRAGPAKREKNTVKLTPNR